MRTLLFQAHFKLSYWVEALHTATYLYNRRSCHPIHLYTSYELLFLQKPDYSHLRSFGCLCFPNLSATTSHKLTPRSTACVFLGYPREHKGYRCLDLSSNKIITSIHVLFYEHIFPLASNEVPSDQPQTSAATSDPSASSLDLVPVISGSQIAHQF
jgi:hypothetical protein